MIEKLMINGVIAAAHDVDRFEFAGEKRWENELRTALKLLSISNAPTMRVTLGEYTIVAREGVAVVVRTGDPIGKSLQRTLSRFARKLRGSVAA